MRDFLGPMPGFFVDVGAHDPKINSQTWHLEQGGWTGVLIEPQPALAEKLRQQRAAKVYAVACSSPTNAGKLMSLHCAGPMSSLDPHWAEGYGGRPNGLLEVPVRSLDQVLTEAKAQAPIDLLSIDVEGHACEVLDGTDLARWRPRLILIEDHVMNLRVHYSLLSKGYQWMRRTGVNSWYVPANTAPAIGLIGRLQFIRKYYLGRPFRHLRHAARRVRGRLRTSPSNT